MGQGSINQIVVCPGLPYVPDYPNINKISPMEAMA